MDCELTKELFEHDIFFLVKAISKLNIDTISKEKRFSVDNIDDIKMIQKKFVEFLVETNKSWCNLTPDEYIYCHNKFSISEMININEVLKIIRCFSLFIDLDFGDYPKFDNEYNTNPLLFSIYHSFDVRIIKAIANTCVKTSKSGKNILELKSDIFSPVDLAIQHLNWEATSFLLDKGLESRDGFAYWIIKFSVNNDKKMFSMNPVKFTILAHDNNYINDPHYKDVINTLFSSNLSGSNSEQLQNLFNKEEKFRKTVREKGLKRSNTIDNSVVEIIDLFWYPSHVLKNRKRYLKLVS